MRCLYLPAEEQLPTEPYIRDRQAIKKNEWLIQNMLGCGPDGHASCDVPNMWIGDFVRGHSVVRY